MARVASDGPFSQFAGIDRTLAILKGNGLTPAIGEAAPVVLDRNAEPLHVPGDTPTTAGLMAGEIINLNVMTRRGCFENHLRRIREPAHRDFDGYYIALAIAYSGKVELGVSHEKIDIADGDTALLMRADDAPFTIAPIGPADCYLVPLRPSRDHAG